MAEAVALLLFLYDKPTGQLSCLLINEGIIMIECENLTKYFVREKPKLMEFAAVDHVNLKAENGQILGILGPNGAGKTTLLRMLVGIMKQDEGLVRIYDEAGQVLNQEDDRKRNIGYLSNNTKLYERLSAREILTTMGRIYGLSEEVIRDRSARIIENLQMEEFADTRIGKLSTGQTQRASLARCFIHDPSIFVLDEPTLGLDIISSQTIIRTMVHEKERGKCVIYSTHYMEEAQYLCDRIIMISHGRILIDDTTANVLARTDTDNLREAFFRLTAEAEGGQA